MVAELLMGCWSALRFGCWPMLGGTPLSAVIAWRWLGETELYASTFGENCTGAAAAALYCSCGVHPVGGDGSYASGGRSARSSTTCTSFSSRNRTDMGAESPVRLVRCVERADGGMDRWCAALGLRSAWATAAVAVGWSRTEPAGRSTRAVPPTPTDDRYDSMPGAVYAAIGLSRSLCA